MSTHTVPRMTVTLLRPANDDAGRVSSLTRAPGGRIYAAEGNEVLVSDDDGRSFRKTPARPGSQAIYGLHADARRVWTVGGGGEHAIHVSDDGGKSWTALPVAHQGNLYRLRCAPDGTFWACGDREALFSSGDGVGFTVPDPRKERQRSSARYLDVMFDDGALVLLSSSGRIERVRGATEETLALSAGKPLSRRLVVNGVWLLFGDAGTAYRSEDGGRSFARIDLPAKGDLEDAVATERGVFVVGAGGAILFSADQGRTFARIPSPIEGHLWSVFAQVDGSLLIAGDDGVVAMVEVSATETMTVPVLPTANAAEAEEDDEDEEEQQPAAAAPPPVPPSQEAASARWKREGREFIGALNRYVRACYEVGPNKAGNEPSETRQDLADYVRGELVRLNAAGEHKRARELFPPAYEPFDYDALGTSIDAVAFLDETRRLVAARERVFVVTPDAIHEVPELRFFGRSSDGKLWAKVYADRIDVHRDWDGARVGSLPHAVGRPEQLVLTPEGDAAAVADADGVSWIHASGAERQLLGRASYAHVALSPNGRFFAYGTQDTSHILLDRKTGQEHRFETVSSYPHFAFFHSDEPALVFSSCHALYGSGSLLVDVQRLADGKSSYARVLDRRSWVYSGASWSDRLLLADRSGYIWARKPGDEEATWYLFLGSTLTALDVARDGKKLLVGSYAGYVIELDLGAPSPDETLLTNGPVKETARWVFWRGHEPLIW